VSQAVKGASEPVKHNDVDGSALTNFPSTMSTLPQHTTRKHSRLAPSKAATWATCTASVPFIEANPDKCKADSSSTYAEEGTKAHEVADCIMRGEKVPHWATKEMIDHAQGYRRFCASLHSRGMVDTDGVERELPLAYLPEENGHVDYMMIDGDTLHVVDYKYGAGVHVEAEGNMQMACYAMSALPEYDEAKHIAMHIYQPRTQHARDTGKAATSWVVDIYKFYDFCEQIRDAAEDILANRISNLRFAPSDKACKWCPISGACPARANQLLTDDMSPVLASKHITLPAPEALTDQQLASLVAASKAIRSFLDDVEDLAATKALAGTPIPGTKLVMGRGSRVWANADHAKSTFSLFGVDLTTEAVLTPAKIEEQIKDRFEGATRKTLLAQLEKLQSKIAGGPVLTTADDKRKPFTLQLNAADEFDTITPQ